MNRFRNKKKGKDDGADESSSGFFRRNKKSAEEPKPAINLDTALPSEDDFRTSLLMTNLSARFSMLREQDDPNTKIGKASDDSVLYPKRQSRMMDYGFGGGLHDIAEVESIKAPPSFLRMDSFASDSDSTKGGSIMDRARPNEGNNLFGGRQKIYKLAAGAVSTGGMSGRALYDDDVASSSFQRWRQAEREGRTLEEFQAAEAEAEPRRSESPPPMGYNRRRETSSTMSSASAMARNSTAATSVTSQPTPSIKDWQSVSTAPPSAASTPVLERSVTRTRRLYEQGLTQDMQDQQTSALSRIDTLARQRTLGSRTPDLAPHSPSPTTSGFHDRFGERKLVLAKASAPNLRSISPPASGSSIGTLDLGIRVPSQPESKPAFGGSPPLSPPISDPGEHPLLAASIQPGDRGKATAMGVFQKPLQPYDESKYAQRQLQLQRGRETPTQRFRTESNASFATDRSRSSSSVRRQPFEAKVDAAKTQPPVLEESEPTSFLDDIDELPPPIASSGLRPAIPSGASFERPSDEDHPALRQPPASSPSAASARSKAEPDSTLDLQVETSRERSPEDSPTLGPSGAAGSSANLGAGLSGMVRQHLRSESNASSIYGLPSAALDAQYGRESHLPNGSSFDPSLVDDLASKANPWTAEERDWARSYYGVEPSLESLKTLAEESDQSPDARLLHRSSDVSDGEADEFATQLADARRRVREKLTSYVESDSSRAGSPTPPGEALPPPPNSLGIGMLKPKSSRGSLIDRSRSIVGSQSKAMKMLGLGSATMSTSPLPQKLSFEEKEIARPIREEEPIPIREEEPIPYDTIPPAQEHESEPEVDARSVSEREEENVHPGLRAFRQARRELQRRKELETLARHQTAHTTSGPGALEEEPPVHVTPKKERAARQRTPSRERRPPPVVAQRIPSDEASHGRPSGDRSRSGSEASGARSRSNSRAPRMRNNSSAYDQHPGQLGSHHGPAPRPMIRSPGLPGTDIRRSPIMPPQGYPSAGPSPLPSPHPDGAKNLTVGVPRGHAGFDASGQPSPVSPVNGALGLPPSPFAMGTSSGAASPTSMGRPSGPPSPASNPTKSSLDESLKRVVKKKDISEPTFVMSTSRVPTVTLPEAKANPDHNGLEEPRSRSRSRSNSSNQSRVAPPLPPINPRRKQEGTRTRATINTLMSRGGHDEPALHAPHPPFGPGSGEHGDENRSSTFSIAEDEDIANYRKRLRKVTADPHRSPGGRPRENIVTGPPASRTVMGSSMNARGAGVPGGMI